MAKNPVAFFLSAAAVTILSACGGGPSAGPTPSMPAEYAALPDTLVCVVDRAMPLGLREIPAKIQGGQPVVVVDGQIAPLSAAHPVNVIAGYAGREEWLTRGEPVTLDGNTFVRRDVERRVGMSLLQRVGEYRGVLLFAGATDAPPPDALYVPTAPGCVFQPFVRQDLLRR